MLERPSSSFTPATEAEAPAPATDWRSRPFAFAPRPKPDPMLTPPAIGWQAARQVQRMRRLAAKGAARAPRQMKDAGGSAFVVARALAELEIEQARQNCPVEQAALALRRRGRVVYRMSVVGGSPAKWFVGGLGKDISNGELVAAADRLAK